MASLKASSAVTPTSAPAVGVGGVPAQFGMMPLGPAGGLGAASMPPPSMLPVGGLAPGQLGMPQLGAAPQMGRVGGVGGVGLAEQFGEPGGFGGMGGPPAMGGMPGQPGPGGFTQQPMGGTAGGSGQMGGFR